MKAGGRELPGLILDLDATLVTCHSEKDQAAPTYKGGFGFHPLLLRQRRLARAQSRGHRPLAWTRVLLLDGELATAEPKKLRYRILHVAARLTRGGRRLHLWIAATWPWRHQLAPAFHRLAALPRPAN